MKKYLFLFMLLFVSAAFAAEKALLIDTAGDALGTSGNPIYATISGAVDLSAVDQGIYPSADNTYPLGSAAKSWSNLYIDGTLYLGGSGMSTVTTDFQVDGDIYNPGINVTAGNYVCFNTTIKTFYVNSSCP